MTISRLLVVAVGGHGRSVVEAAELSGQFEGVGFLYDSVPAGKLVLYVAVLWPLASVPHYRSVVDQTIVAFGNNALREKLMQQLAAMGFALAAVVHSRAILSPSTVLCSGSVVMSGAIVGA